MGHLSRLTIERLYTACLIGGYQEGGIWGRTRLQKVNALTEYESPLRPFSVRKDNYGQFSPALFDTLDELLASQLVRPFRIQSSDGNDGMGYRLAGPGRYAPLRGALAKVSSELVDALDHTRDEYGYMELEALKEEAYRRLPSDVDHRDVLLEGNVPEAMEVEGLSDEECEELELTLNPRFGVAIGRIVSALESAAIDFDEVRPLGDLSAAGA